MPSDHLHLLKGEETETQSWMDDFNNLHTAICKSFEVLCFEFYSLLLLFS
jgi:hypothetical protein